MVTLASSTRSPFLFTPQVYVEHPASRVVFTCRKKPHQDKLITVPLLQNLQSVRSNILINDRKKKSNTPGIRYILVVPMHDGRLYVYLTANVSQYILE